MANTTVVYSAITGGYDDIRDPEMVSPGCRYICFSDDPQKVRSRFWEAVALQDLEPSVKEATRRSRRPKIMPHQYLEDADLSIWVDGNLTIRGDLNEFAELALSGGHSLAFFEHPERARNWTIWDAQQNCIRLGKDDPDVINAQMEGYRREGFKGDRPIPTCAVIVRRHNDPPVVRTMELWWAEVRDKSRRDQLSFVYAAAKTGITCNEVPCNVRDNKWFLWRPHDSKVRTEAKRTGN